MKRRRLRRLQRFRELLRDSDGDGIGDAFDNFPFGGCGFGFGDNFPFGGGGFGGGDFGGDNNNGCNNNGGNNN